MKVAKALLLVLVSAAALAIAAQSKAPPAVPRSEALSFDALLYDSKLGSLVLVNGHRPSAPPERVHLWTWSGAAWQLLSDTGPSMRTVTAVAYDARRGRIVLHGGLGREGISDARGDTWEWDGRCWLEHIGLGPGALDHHALTFDEARGKVVLFGGVGTTAGLRSPNSDTWEWDEVTWIRASTGGPSARTTTLVNDAKRKEVVLFGGVGGDMQRLGDTWGWNGVMWRLLAEEGPAPRNGHSLAFDPVTGVVLLFGGTNGSEHFEDLWSWDGLAWTELQVTGERPGKRVGAGLAYDLRRGRTALYGGHVRVGSEVQESDEMWEWDGRLWTRVH